MAKRDWTGTSGRRRGVLTGAAGLLALALVALPLWISSAGAVITGVQYGPFIGFQGTGITFTGLTECLDIPGTPTDVGFEVNTQADGRLDQRVRAHNAQGTYTIDAPPEFDAATDPTAGPTYDVSVACITNDGLETVTFDNGFRYLRPGGGTTTSTAPGSTTSTTAGSTTSTTAGSTTSTTAGSTTSTTAGTTTSTTAGSTTSTTAASTTSTTAGSTTSTTAASTTSTTAASTTSTTSGGSSTSSTTSSSVPGSSTTVTTPASSSTSSTTPDGSSTSSSTSSTVATSTTVAGASVSDTTPDRGQTITVTGSGFGPGTTVQVDILSTPIRLTTLTANADGVATGQVTIPRTTTTGSHQIRLTGVTASGTELVHSVAITVGGSIPRTGTDTWTTLRIGVLLLGLGLLAAGRAQLLSAR